MIGPDEPSRLIHPVLPSLSRAALERLHYCPPIVCKCTQTSFSEEEVPQFLIPHVRTLSIPQMPVHTVAGQRRQLSEIIGDAGKLTLTTAPGSIRGSGFRSHWTSAGRLPMLPMSVRDFRNTICGKKIV